MSYRALLSGTLLASILLISGSAAAEDDPLSNEKLFEKASTALSVGEYGTAIDSFEALADRGFLHPDASYDRGLAYLMRIRARSERPGDLGRAAAAFEETIRLSPGDRDAEVVLDLVRAEVTRRRSRKGSTGIDARPTLDRVIVRLLSDRTWTLLSVIASVLLAIGILLRRVDRPKAPAPAEPSGEGAVTAEPVRPAHPVHVAGTVVVAVTVVLLLAFVPLAWHARTLRLTTRSGVVIATDIHLTDDTGRTLSGDPIPEAASVEVGERRGALIHLRWGTSEGWAPATSVRILP